MIGELLDHYRVQELIGRGAMGIVYRALDENLERPVALKVMSAEARNDPDFVERFRLEARLQGALNHPNVAVLFDYFVHDGAPVAVMEFIDGESLQQLIRRRGAIPAHEAVPIFKQALRGVAAAHRAGIIHRDLKPSNLMVTRDGIVKVMDFGIAKRQGTSGATKFSTSIGTSLYMAPEQILGRSVDCRTDVYALGITLYELLSGQPPFNPRDKAEFLVLNAHVNEAPQPPTVHCPNIAQPLVDAVMCALAKQPDARFQSVDEFLSALPDFGAPTQAASQAQAEGTPPIGSVPSRTVPIRTLPLRTLPLDRTPGDPAPVSAAPARTVTIDFPPRTAAHQPAARGPTGTIALARPASAQRESGGTLAFEYSAATLAQEFTPGAPAPSPTLSSSRADGMSAPVALAASAVLEGVTPRPSAPPSAVSAGAASAPVPGSGARSSLRKLLRERPATAAVLLTIVLGALVFGHAQRLHRMHREASAISSAPRMADASTSMAPPVPAAAPAPADLSGTWRGEYVDGSGKQLLRVVSLSIRRVYEDGGIEGTLRYEAASGDGECRLQPRGSSYSADNKRLQLSPEACSAHYPRELSVPLDFDGVTPGASTLKDGRIEAPTGEVISVELSRVTGT